MGKYSNIASGVVLFGGLFLMCEGWLPAENTYTFASRSERVYNLSPRQREYIRLKSELEKEVPLEQILDKNISKVREMHVMDSTLEADGAFMDSMQTYGRETSSLSQDQYNMGYAGLWIALGSLVGLGLSLGTSTIARIRRAMEIGIYQGLERQLSDMEQKSRGRTRGKYVFARDFISERKANAKKRARNDR